MRVPLNRNVIDSRFNWQRVVLLAISTIAAFAVVIFGLRTYRSFLLLHSAYELGAPDLASLRAWMTLDYVARIYRVSGTELTDGLGLSSNEDPKTTLKSLAERQGVSPFKYIQQAQEASRGYVPSHCLQAGAMVSASRTHSATAFLPRCWSTVTPCSV